MKNLLIVWKTDNDIDIHNFVVPYAYNAQVHDWFNRVEVLIWGASQEKVSNDTIIQQRVKNLIKNEIKVYACQMCATKLNVLKLLKELGVEVEFTGSLLSDRLKDPDWEVLSL